MVKSDDNHELLKEEIVLSLLSRGIFLSMKSLDSFLLRFVYPLNQLLLI
jgi:hypothetical protein